MSNPTEIKMKKHSRMEKYLLIKIYKKWGCLKMVKILSSASFFLKKEKTEIKSRQNGIIEL